MSEFRIQSEWLPKKGTRDEIGATFCALTIDVADQNVTRFVAEHEEGSDAIELPSYYLAEWFAENWWALLWEPRKNEDGAEDDSDFLMRHSTLAAQHGFHLPQLLFVSNGPYISISAIARNVPMSDVRFVNRSRAFVEQSMVSSVLSEFVSECVIRLENAGYKDSLLQEYWSLISNTDADAVPYCQMMGALGLSPYATHPEVDSLLFQLCEKIGETYTRDFCLVARPEELKATARAARVAVAALKSSPTINIETVVSIAPPRDNRLTQAWLRGRRAAVLLRDRLSVSDTDQIGADKIFDSIGLDPTRQASIGEKDLQPEGAAIVGAVHRDGNDATIACTQRFVEQRRFSAARGLFSAWASVPHGGHLLTQAVTRHQQASRAFAAELLAPISYIKKWAKGRLITFDDVTEIAQNLTVGSDVVYKQAANNGLVIRPR